MPTVSCNVNKELFEHVERKAKESGFSTSGYVRFLLQTAEGFTPRFFETMIRELSDRYTLAEGCMLELAAIDLLAKSQADPEYKTPCIVKKENGGIKKGLALLDHLRTKYHMEKVLEYQEFFAEK